MHSIKCMNAWIIDNTTSGTPHCNELKLIAVQWCHQAYRGCMWVQSVYTSAPLKMYVFEVSIYIM